MAGKNLFVSEHQWKCITQMLAHSGYTTGLNTSE